MVNGTPNRNKTSKLLSTATCAIVLFLAGCGYQATPYGTLTSFQFRMEIHNSQAASMIQQTLAGQPPKKLWALIIVSKGNSNGTMFYSEKTVELTPAAVLNGEVAAYASSGNSQFLIEAPLNAKVEVFVRAGLTQSDETNTWGKLTGEKYYTGSQYVTWGY